MIVCLGVNVNITNRMRLYIENIVNDFTNVSTNGKKEIDK